LGATGDERKGTARRAKLTGEARQQKSNGTWSWVGKIRINIRVHDDNKRSTHNHDSTKGAKQELLFPERKEQRDPGAPGKKGGTENLHA